MTNVLTSSAHFAVRSDRPLSDQQLYTAAPSVFANRAHGSRSTRYCHIPTLEIINGLRAEGFMPFMACQSRSRLADKAAFTKHLLRFRQQRHSETQALQESVNEIILVNSHDGSSSYQMLAGCFRFVCLNGLVCGDSIEEFRVRHTGDVLHHVIKGAYRMVSEFEQLDAAKTQMQQVQLSTRQQLAFARKALELRYPKKTHCPISVQQLNQVRRKEDQGATLWQPLIGCRKT